MWRIKQTQTQRQINADLQQQINDLKNTIAQMQSGNYQSATSIQNSNLKTSDIAQLQQNAPNPFSQSCYIKYYIPSSVHQSLLIIADAGGHVLKQYNISSTGFGQQSIDGGSLASGVYTYSLYLDGKLFSTKQMILTK